MKGSPIRPSTRYKVKHLCLTPKYLLSLLLGNVYDGSNGGDGGNDGVSGDGGNHGIGDDGGNHGIGDDGGS